MLEVGVLTQLIEIIDRGLFARLDAHVAARARCRGAIRSRRVRQIVRRVSSSPSRRACQSGAVPLSAPPAKPILRDGFGIRTSQPIGLRGRRAWRDRRGTSGEKPGAGHRSFAPSFSARRAAFALRAGTGDYHRPRKCSRWRALARRQAKAPPLNRSTFAHRVIFVSESLALSGLHHARQHRSLGSPARSAKSMMQVRTTVR